MHEYPSTTAGQPACAAELSDRFRHALPYLEETRRTLVTVLNPFERSEHEREEGDNAGAV